MSHMANSPALSRGFRSPPGLSRDARTLLDQESRRIWEPPATDVRSTTRLSEPLGEIAQLRDLGEDWDLDGARAIDKHAIQLSSRVVRSVAKLVEQEGVNWQPPEIGPVPDGSVAVTWEGTHRDVLMIFRPGQTAAVECVTQEEGAQPVRQVVSEAEAIRLALWALTDR